MSEIRIPSPNSAFKKWSKNNFKPISRENITENIVGNIFENIKEYNNNLYRLTGKKRKIKYITTFKSSI